VSFHHRYALVLRIIMVRRVVILNAVLKLILAISVVAHVNLALIMGHGLKVTM